MITHFQIEHFSFIFFPHYVFVLTKHWRMVYFVFRSFFFFFRCATSTRSFGIEDRQNGENTNLQRKWMRSRDREWREWRERTQHKHIPCNTFCEYIDYITVFLPFYILYILFASLLAAFHFLFLFFRFFATFRFLCFIIILVCVCAPSAECISSSIRPPRMSPSLRRVRVYVPAIFFILFCIKYLYKMGPTERNRWRVGERKKKKEKKIL